MAHFNGPLRRPPVVYVVCQIRFAPFPRPEAVIDRVHEAMNEAGFARQDEQVRSIKISPNAPAEFTEHEKRARFDNRDGTIGYIIAPDQLAVHRTAYTRFEDFLDNIVFGFRALIAATKLPFIQRVGLRYVDLITPADNETVAQYVVDRLLGFEPQVAGVASQAAQQFVQLLTAQGRMFVKSSRAKHQQPVPVDLLPLSLTPQRTPNAERESFILDIDHFADNLKLDPDVDELATRVRALQDPMADIFREALTPYAVEKFEPVKAASTRP